MLSQSQASEKRNISFLDEEVRSTLGKSCFIMRGGGKSQVAVGREEASTEFVDNFAEIGLEREGERVLRWGED